MSQPILNTPLLDLVKYLCFNMIVKMSTETLKNNLNKDVPITRVNVGVLKNRIIEKKKKKDFKIK